MKKGLRATLAAIGIIVLNSCATSMVSQSPMITAAKSHDSAAMKALLAQGASACDDGGFGFPPYTLDKRFETHETAGMCNTEPFRAMMERAVIEQGRGAKCPGLITYAAYGGCTDLVEKLLDQHVNIESRYHGMPALGAAAFYGQQDTIKLLLRRGANLDTTISSLKELSASSLPYLHVPAVRTSYDKCNSAADLLENLRGEAGQLKAQGETREKSIQRQEEEKQKEASFQAALAASRKGLSPALPELARKYKVQAEGAVEEKDFEGAIELYGKALKIAPGWAEGHFNRALLLSEAKDYATAIIEMKRYLALMPKAPNARTVRDKIYQWERKAEK